MKRSPISKLFDPTERFKLGRITADEALECNLVNHYGYVGIYNHTGKLEAFIGEDDLFDNEGNRFEMDE